MPVSLKIVRGKHEGRVFDLRGESRAVIGRAPESTITLDDALLSWKHCRIDFSAEEVRLVDLHSTNGTFLNKKRVEMEAMAPNDFFQVGGNLFQILPLAKRTSGGGDSFLCPRCRESVSVPEEHREGEITCPHCKRTSTPGSDILGDYHLLEIIGRGSTGLVYKASDLKEGRIVALKAVKLDGDIDAKTISRYLRVSHTEGRLFHPNIVQVYRTAKSSGFFTIAMEYIDGITLYQKICEEDQLEVGEAIRIANQVASALVHTSQKGIVHRDVKPENILVTRGSVAKLMDFSIAKRIRPTPEAPVTLAGEGLGTMHYVPPEQIYDAANVDERADVYALGCTLYHMLTGTPPFKAPKGQAKRRGILMRILSGDCPPIEEFAPSVPDEVSRIVSRAMAREVGDRYQGSVELLRDLKKVARQF